MQDVEEFPPEPNPEKDGDGDKKIRPTVRSAVDLQRLKVEKLMKNPNKQIIIPEFPKEKDYLQSVPSFVRNVMGSSAGAGSGEFHVYRHLRRKEYARQKFIQSKSLREQLDDQYRDKLANNKSAADLKTAKKRAKRLKKKQRKKEMSKKPKVENNVQVEDNHISSDDSGCAEELEPDEEKHEHRLYQDDNENLNDMGQNLNNEGLCNEGNLDYDDEAPSQLPLHEEANRYH